MVLLSISSDQPLTGGYRYNTRLAGELRKSNNFTYIYESPRFYRSAGELSRRISVQETVIIDSIFFAYPDLLRHAVSILPAGIVLLLHWLPWIEEELLHREISINRLDPRAAGSLSAGKHSLSLLDLFDRFIVTSEFSRNELIRRGIGGERVCIAYPGIDPDMVALGKAEIRRIEKKPNGPVRFATLAHWTPVKGIHRLPELFSNRTKNGWEWHSVGDPNRDTSYGKELIRRMREEGLTQCSFIHGALPPDRAREQVLSCDCMLVPSLFETYGMAAAEAAALGIPVIAMDAGGLREAVRPGVDGILCKSLEDFQETVNRVLEDRNELSFLNRKRESSQVRTWEQTASIIQQFLG